MHALTVTSHTDVRHRTLSKRLLRAILAGFAASTIMLLLFVVAYNLARLLSVASVLASATVPRQWLANLTHNRLIDAGLADVYVAAAVYLAGGLLWAALYALVEPRLRGPAWLRGATFALVPALVSLVIVLPMLGGGLFGAALGAGPLPTLGNLLLHVAYGAVLGLVYGPVGDFDASTLHAPAPGQDPALDRLERAYDGQSDRRRAHSGRARRPPPGRCHRRGRARDASAWRVDDGPGAVGGAAWRRAGPVRGSVLWPVQREQRRPTRLTAPTLATESGRHLKSGPVVGPPAPLGIGRWPWWSTL